MANTWSEIVIARDHCESTISIFHVIHASRLGSSRLNRDDRGSSSGRGVGGHKSIESFKSQSHEVPPPAAPPTHHHPTRLGAIVEMSWKCRGNVVEMSWKRRGRMSRKCPAGGREGGIERSSAIIATIGRAWNQAAARAEASRTPLKGREPRV
jgi:hypothetical protein